MTLFALACLALLGQAEVETDGKQRAVEVHRRWKEGWNALTAQGIALAFTEHQLFLPISSADLRLRATVSGMDVFLGERLRQEYMYSFDGESRQERTIVYFDGALTHTISIREDLFGTVLFSRGRPLINAHTRKDGFRRITRISAEKAEGLLHPENWLYEQGGIAEESVRARRKKGTLDTLLTHRESTDSQDRIVLVSYFADPVIRRGSGFATSTRILVIDPSTNRDARRALAPPRVRGHALSAAAYG